MRKKADKKRTADSGDEQVLLFLFLLFVFVVVFGKYEPMFSRSLLWRIRCASSARLGQFFSLAFCRLSKVSKRLVVVIWKCAADSLQVVRRLPPAPALRAPHHPAQGWFPGCRFLVSGFQIPGSASWFPDAQFPVLALGLVIWFRIPNSRLLQHGYSIVCACGFAANSGPRVLKHARSGVIVYIFTYIFAY